VDSTNVRGEATRERSGYELFPHGADVGVRGWGPTVAEAFEGAARALTSVVTDPERIEPREALVIECEAPDQEILFVDWLNEIIAEMSARKMVFGRFAVAVEGRRLRARIAGERVERTRHEPAVEPKGATMTELSVKREGDAWIAQCVVDV